MKAGGGDGEGEGRIWAYMYKYIIMERELSTQKFPTSHAPPHSQIFSAMPYNVSKPWFLTHFQKALPLQELASVWEKKKRKKRVYIHIYTLCVV